MAEVTKRKLTAVYSMIVGFFLSLFSGHVHAGALFYSPKSKTDTGQRTQTINKTSPVSIVPHVGNEAIQAPKSTEEASNIVPSVSNEAAPAPLSNTAAGETENAEEIEDVGMMRIPDQTGH